MSCFSCGAICRGLATLPPYVASDRVPESSLAFAANGRSDMGPRSHRAMAQQVSTVVACRFAERAKFAYPQLMTPSPAVVPDPNGFRALGLPQRRADCCAEIVRRSDEILANIKQGRDWEQALAGIKGIGPWTISVFRIMVLRHPDVLPLGDVGLQRAIDNVYGGGRDVASLSEAWRPFRSVACWYLWRTLGNLQLG